MALTTEEKKVVLGEYGLHPTDTGSPEAQVAMLSKRISDLTEHLKNSKLTVMDQITIENPKTCDGVAFIKSMGFPASPTTRRTRWSKHRCTERPSMDG